jgi:hypothetical protein
MEADFSGYATKVGLKCSDGRTIMPDAFKHQDQTQVPLVWQHSHKDPENVLGHVILENRADGVYAYGFFNETAKAAHAKALVNHRDINMMSIWANELIERSKRVIHGAIREVSLVLSGANPGALIDNVSIRHSDGDEEYLEDEVIIYTGLPLIHGIDTVDVEEKEEVVEHMDDPMTDQTKVDTVDDSEETVKDVYDSMTDKQKDVVHFMVGEAIQAATTSAEDTTNTDTTNTAEHGDNTEGSEMSNVFENTDAAADKHILSHDAIVGIVADAKRSGSLKDAVEQYALSHGIDNIDLMFPEAQLVTDTPEFLSRRTEWVNEVLSGARKSPFTRIKTLSADITMEDARARGYVKGDLKKEEFFGVTKRVTTPQTIYKKQKLDRDDIVDITDFDVVAWLKAEMRLMLDEELARAVLIGDGRDIAHDDKISESNIRPIANDHELFTTTVNVNIDDASSSVQEIIDAIVTNRKEYKGSGLPTFYTSETYISKFLLLKDTLGRRIYKSLEEIASELRVAAIVPVEAMEENPSTIGILVNMVDYVIGADQGGSISMFDDFDIDYNQHKYLIETRVSGALVRLKSAIVVKKVAANAVLVTPTAPTFVAATGELSIPTVTGVVYKNGAGTVINTAGSPYTVAPGATYLVNATPATAGYYFATSEDDSWSFTADA